MSEIENNKPQGITNKKKKKTIYNYVFSSIIIGVLFFLIINITYGLISFNEVINEKEPKIYMNKNTYTKNGKNVVVYKNFIYKIVVTTTSKERNTEIKIWFLGDLD